MGVIGLGDYVQQRQPEGRDIVSSATSRIGEGNQGVPKVG